jgi:hypothetical protein
MPWQLLSYSALEPANNTCGAAMREACELHTGAPRTEPHRDRKLPAAEAAEKRNWQAVTGHVLLPCLSRGPTVMTTKGLGCSRVRSSWSATPSPGHPTDRELSGTDGEILVTEHIV